MGFSWTVGWKFLVSRQRSHVSFITSMAVAGVTIGVSALLIITAISSGFLEAFKEKVLGVNAHVIVLKVGETFHEYRDVTKKARRQPGVVAAAPFIITEMMMAKDRSISGILIKGIDPDGARKILDLPRHIEKGDIESLHAPALPPPAAPKEPSIDLGSILDEESGAAGPGGKGTRAAAASPAQLPGMIIGRTLASNIRARVGDTVTVISPLMGLDTSFTDDRIDTSISASFRVTGVFYSGFDEYDSRLVYVNLLEAQRLFGYGDSVTGVELRVRDIEKAREVAQDLEGKLSGGLYRIIDWEELNHPLFTALLVQKLALTVVLMLSVLMASLNIISMLILFITNKKRDISVLKSLGATRGQVVSIFMIVGVATGAIGLALGSLVGFSLSRLLVLYKWPLDPKVYLIDHLPLSLGASDFLLCAGVTLAICVLFTVFPSLKAASLNPVEGIKYE